jgi:hypothetical protein
MQFTDPLPEFQRVALAGSFELHGRPYTLRVSPIQRFADYGPEFDVIHVAVDGEGRPLALADLAPSLPPDECFRLWSGLCAAVQDAVAAAYALAAAEDGQPNPRLGCWGPRPDLIDLGESDCATALVLGVAVDTRAATFRPRSAMLAQAIAAALMGALREWETVARDA